MDYCPECGAQITLTKTSEIQGWLLLLCLGLTVFFPIMTYNAIDTNYKLLPQMDLASTYSTAYKIVQFENYKMAIIAFVGFIGGVLLWLRNGFGLYISKIFFVMIILSNMLALVYVRVWEVPQSIERIILSSGVTLNVLLSAISILALVYLYKSERVDDIYATKVVI